MLQFYFSEGTDHGEGKPPEIKYSLDSTSRRSYREPALFPHLFDRKQITTRFGHTPHTMPARGIGKIRSDMKRSCVS